MNTDYKLKEKTILRFLQLKKLIKDAKALAQGKLRYRLWYSSFSWLIRPYIREQIIFRINSMNPNCYIQGECILCGCTTTALQMADKACNKPCYPKMLSKEDFITLQKGLSVKQGHLLWKLKGSRFIEVWNG